MSLYRIGINTERVPAVAAAITPMGAPQKQSIVPMVAAGVISGLVLLAIAKATDKKPSVPTMSREGYALRRLSARQRAEGIAIT